jgi:diguanylate cyclase (GGDEF)-like protein
MTELEKEVHDSSASAPSPKVTKTDGALVDEGAESTSGAVPPPKHPREEERLAKLQDFTALDTTGSPTLDSLVKLAATICDTPIAYISMVDRKHQWFLSSVGIDLRETCADDSFCGYTILSSDEMFIVPDTKKDPRFKQNPYVTGHPHIGFYAGVPLSNGDGLAIGSLSIVDVRPRELTTLQLQMLRELSHVAMNILCIKRNNAKVGAFSDLIHSLLRRLFKFANEGISKPSTSRGDLLDDIISHLNPAQDWISARITSGENQSYRVVNNHSKGSAMKAEDLWEKVDALTHPDGSVSGSHKSFNPGIPEQGFALLMFSTHSTAKSEPILQIIVPNQLEQNHWNNDLLQLMTSNVAIVLEREIMNVELVHKASHDPLTGAANRTLILSKLSDAIQNIVPGRVNSALFFIDLDDFKDVNDNFGHHTGDDLLIAIAERLKTCSRENDLVGRLSGDEFVLLANDVGNDEDLERLLKRLNASFKHPHRIDGHLLKITASIGCIPINDRSTTVESLMQQAEGVMYLVKNGHRKGICVADEGILRMISHKRSMIIEVKEALNMNRLSLYAQPIIDLERGAIVGAEFLLRITGRNGRILPSEAFMSTIERSHYLVRIDEWVFGEALRIMKSFTDQLISIDGFYISINITPAVLNILNYGAKCISRIREHGIDPSHLMMEITENNLIPFIGTVIENLHALRAGGVRIAVDDFGTGYSNLQNLSTLPLDFIKIDRTLVTASSGNTKRESLLSASTSIAKNLNLEIIAEGIETKEDENLVRSLGCRYAQGFFYARPMPMDHFLKVLQKQSFLSDFSGILTTAESAPPSDHPAFTAGTAVAN